MCDGGWFQPEEKRQKCYIYRLGKLGLENVKLQKYPLDKILQKCHWSLSRSLVSGDHFGGEDLCPFCTKRWLACWLDGGELGSDHFKLGWPWKLGRFGGLVARRESVHGGMEMVANGPEERAPSIWAENRRKRGRKTAGMAPG